MEFWLYYDNFLFEVHSLCLLGKNENSQSNSFYIRGNFAILCKYQPLLQTKAAKSVKTDE